MSRITTEEEKLLFKPYVSLTTIQRYFSLSKIDALDVFTKVQKLDEKEGYITIYTDRVRSEGVMQLLGLDYDKAIKRFEMKRKMDGKNEK